MRSSGKIYELTQAAVCTALLCVCAYIVIPLPMTPVVLSLHTIAVNLTGLIMRPKNAALTVICYLLLGAVGLPVFAGGTAGIGKLFGPTGGFYFGFLLAVIVISFVKGKRTGVRNYAIACLCALPVQHIAAVLFMCFYNDFDIISAVMTVSVPFLAGDVIKCIAAAFIADAVRRRFDF